MPSEPYRVLLLAEAANPDWASVPLVGWGLSQALAKITNAHLVTQIRNREALLTAGLVEGRDFTAVNNEAWVRPIWKIGERLRGGSGKGWTTAMAFSSLTYYSFELEVWRQLGPRIKAHEFDLVHRITPLVRQFRALLLPGSRGITYPLCLARSTEACRGLSILSIVNTLSGSGFLTSEVCISLCPATDQPGEIVRQLL